MSNARQTFRKNLQSVRQGPLQEGWKDTTIAKDTVDFAKTTGKDVALSAVPFYSAGEEGVTAYDRYKKGNYLSAAKHAAAATVYGGIDTAAALLTLPSAGGSQVVGTGAKLGVKGLIAGGKALLKKLGTKQIQKAATAETGKVSIKSITGPKEVPKLSAPETPKALPPPSQSVKAPPPPKAPAPSKAQNGISAEPSKFKGGETAKPKSLEQIKKDLPKPTATKEPTNIQTMPMQKAGEPIPTNKSLTVQRKKSQEVTKVEPKTKLETKPETKTKEKTKETAKEKGKPRGRLPFIPPIGSVDVPKPTDLTPKGFKLGVEPRTPGRVTPDLAAQASSQADMRRQAKQWASAGQIKEGNKDNSVLKDTKPGEFTLKDRIAAKGLKTPEAVVGSQADLYSRLQRAKREASIWNKQQNESNLSIVKNMVENKIPNAELYFDDRSVSINNRIAKKLINVYESLNKENRKKVEQMLNEDISSYKKLINFAIRQ